MERVDPVEGAADALLATDEVLLVVSRHGRYCERGA
jgi:hypothetical protein